MKKSSLVQVDEGKRDINCLTLRCKVSLSLYSQPLTLPGTALLQWTGLKRNEPAAGGSSPLPPTNN